MAACCLPPEGGAGAGRLLEEESSHWRSAYGYPVSKQQQQNDLPRGNARLAQMEAGQVPVLDNYKFRKHRV